MVSLNLKQTTAHRTFGHSIITKACYKAMGCSDHQVAGTSLKLSLSSLLWPRKELENNITCINTDMVVVLLKETFSKLGCFFLRVQVWIKFLNGKHIRSYLTVSIRKSPTLFCALISCVSSYVYTEQKKLSKF